MGTFEQDLVRLIEQGEISYAVGQQVVLARCADETVGDVLARLGARKATTHEFVEGWERFVEAIRASSPNVVGDVLRRTGGRMHPTPITDALHAVSLLNKLSAEGRLAVIRSVNFCVSCGETTCRCVTTTNVNPLEAPKTKI